MSYLLPIIVDQTMAKHINVNNHLMYIASTSAKSKIPIV